MSYGPLRLKKRVSLFRNKLQFGLFMLGLGRKINHPLEWCFGSQPQKKNNPVRNHTPFSQRSVLGEGGTECRMRVFTFKASDRRRIAYFVNPERYFYFPSVK